MGSRVALVAPAGPLRGEADLERSVANARSLGWQPVAGDYVLERDGYLAGSDANRAADLNRFARDPDIEAIWCIRGGYGAMRILEQIDYGAWRAQPKTLIGYSDVTALHAAIGQRAELVTFHGPTARAELSEMTRRSFLDAVARENGDAPPLGIHAEGATTLRAGAAHGRLVGGNLALVAALAGTPYAWNLDGAIVVLEDVTESVYRIDRMLMQLWLSGGLRRLAGLVFGQFTEIPDDSANAEWPLERVLRETAERCGVPTIANFPLGHIHDQVTLPFGAPAHLDADRRTLTISNIITQ
ncbi:MAG TPA: LD-carboxypeptidase [Gemmatimonadaceae bacterium]|nr:LD-carboxypeptidase [Gemmatimonadaceae bacterium]